MSGGHWDYSQFKIRDALEDVGKDGRVLLRFPKLSQIMRDFSTLFEQVIHDLDYDLSDDSYIDNDEKFEQKFIEKIGKIVKKKYKVRVYDVSDEK